MNKRGIFVPTLVVVTLVVLIYAYVVLTTGLDLPSPSKVIGEVQLKMIDQYQRGEAILFYVDQAAKYSGYKAADDLGKNGGFYSRFPCGKNEEYAIWEFTRDCNPVENVKNLEKNFKNYLNKNLNEYLKTYPDIEIPKDNYEYELKKVDDDLEITGIADKQIITKIKEGFDIDYAVLPSFKQRIKYNLNDYERIINEVKKESVISCLKSKENLDDCIDMFGLRLEIKKEGDFVKFDISRDSLFGVVTIRFAINLSEIGEEEEEEKEINYEILKGKVIAIDPGCEEKESEECRALNLGIAKELLTLINPYSNKVFLIREEDIDCKSKEERCNDANNKNAEIFVGIESTLSPEQKEIRYFVNQENGKPSVYGEKLAELIGNELGFEIEGSQEILLRKTRMPAVVIYFLKGNVNKKESAEQILRGIVNYFEFKKEEDEKIISEEAKIIDSRIERYESVIEKAAADYGWSVFLVKGLIATESSGRACAESSAGAVGLTQMTKIAVDDLNEKGIGEIEWKWEDVKDCSKGEINIKAGTANLYLIRENYVNKHLKLSDETESSFAIYNAGVGTVEDAIDGCLGSRKEEPLCHTFGGYKEYLPKDETREYVPKVLAFADAFRTLALA